MEYISIIIKIFIIIIGFNIYIIKKFSKFLDGMGFEPMKHDDMFINFQN
jgi:hypothetical protein